MHMHTTARPLRPRQAGLLLLLGSVLLAGCISDDPTAGYTARSPFRTGIHTVAVPLWTRGQDVYRRDLEIRLTEALIKRIELTTPYKVVDKQNADSLLTGTLDRIDQATLSFNPDDGTPREIQVAFVVSFQWEDLRSGATLVKKKNFRVTSVYLPPDPFDESFFQGSGDLIERLAIRIVETMEADWGE